MSKVSGETTIHCVINKIDNDKAFINTIDGFELEIDFIDGMESILGKTISLEGIATWNTDTHQISEFKPIRIGEYEEIDLVSAFKELRKDIGEYYKNIDAIKFVNDSRSE